MPIGYPGWQGYLIFKVQNRHQINVPDLFRNTSIHLGSGGSNDGIEYGYDVRLFENDWPGLLRYKTYGILSESDWKCFRYNQVDIHFTPLAK